MRIWDWIWLVPFLFGTWYLIAAVITNHRADKFLAAAERAFKKAKDYENWWETRPPR